MKTISIEQFNKQYGTSTSSQFTPSKGIDYTKPSAISGQPSFTASTGGGVSDIPINIAKTFGNIPSSAINIARQAVAPVNPLNTESKLNIGANIAKSGSELLNIGKEQTFGQATKNIFLGFLDTAKKIFLAPGKAYMDYLKSTGYEDSPTVKKAFEVSVLKPMEAVARIGIEDPLLIPSLLTGNKGSVDNISNVANTVTRGADTSLANIANKIENKSASIIDNTIGKASDAVTDIVKSNLPDSATIMNRVARLNHTEFNKFTKLAGETPGEYLARTGNFASPDTIIANEAKKFSQSIESVDREINKLPGLYRNGAVDDALSGLLKKANAESGANIKSPYLEDVKRLIQKNETDGLTMEEINKVKRLYEKNVKLGYNMLTDSEKVKQATNIDSSLRQWQLKTAKDLGFTNLDELNKQTQLSKFIINKLGKQIVGQSGLNGLNLTDWIMLSGGNANAISGFLTKKFFSSKGVQAKIAELLNKNKIDGIITPKTIITPENAFRASSPKGLLQLEAGKAGPQSSSYIPIKVAPRGSNIEITSKQGITTSKQIQQPQSKIKSFPLDLSIPSNKLLPSGQGKNYVGTGATIYLPKSVVKESLGLNEIENATIRVTKINRKTGDVYIKDIKSGKTTVIPSSKYRNKIPKK